MYARRPICCVWDSQFLIPKSMRVAFHAEVLKATAKEVRCRVWRVVGVGVGLLRHDGEVEGVVVKDDAVLELRNEIETCALRLSGRTILVRLNLFSCL